METLLDGCVGKMLTGNLIPFPADQTMPSTKQSEKVSDGDYLGRARPHLQSDEEAYPEPMKYLGRLKSCGPSAKAYVEIEMRRGGPARPFANSVFPRPTGVLTCDGCGRAFHGVGCHQNGSISLSMMHSWQTRRETYIQ